MLRLMNITLSARQVFSVLLSLLASYTAMLTLLSFVSQILLKIENESAYIYLFSLAIGIIVAAFTAMSAMSSPLALRKSLISSTVLLTILISGWFILNYNISVWADSPENAATECLQREGLNLPSLVVLKRELMIKNGSQDRVAFSALSSNGLRYRVTVSQFLHNLWQCEAIDTFNTVIN